MLYFNRQPKEVFVNIIEIDFVNKNRSLESFRFKPIQDSQLDAKVLAYHLYDVIENYENHFEANMKNTKYKISDFNIREFKHQIIALKQFIGTCLERLHISSFSSLETHKIVKESVIKDLLILNKVDFLQILDWFEVIGIPYNHTKVINFNNYIGLKA